MFVETDVEQYSGMVGGGEGEAEEVLVGGTDGEIQEEEEEEEGCRSKRGMLLPVCEECVKVRGGRRGQREARLRGLVFGGWRLRFCAQRLKVCGCGRGHRRMRDIEIVDSSCSRLIEGAMSHSCRLIGHSPPILN